MTILNIMIDQREPEPIPSMPYGGPSGISCLSAGSAWCLCGDGQMLAIWRLDAADFFHAIRDDSLFGRAAALKAVSPWAYLVIQGAIAPGKDGKIERDSKPNVRSSSQREQTGWSWGAYQGALLSLQEIGVAVLHIGSSVEQYVSAVQQLAARNRGPRRCEPLREALFPDVAEQVLTAFPGIGPAKAAKLLAECGTLAWSLVALAETPAGHTALGLLADQVLTIHMKEDAHDNNRPSSGAASRPSADASASGGAGTRVGAPAGAVVRPHA